MDASVTFRLAGLALPKENDKPACSGTQQVAEEEFLDESLLAQVSLESKDALALLFRRYAGLVRGIAYRILRDPSEADDLLQELFLFIYRKSGTFDSSKCSARSWIVQMTYHRAIDQRRYLQSRHFYTCVALDGTTDLLDPHSETARYSEFRDKLVGNATIPRLLGSLTEDQRNTLSLHFFEGYTFGEIAVKLDQSLGNIRNHYYRGLDHLRKLMFSSKLLGRNACGKK